MGSEQSPSQKMHTNYPSYKNYRKISIITGNNHHAIKQAASNYMSLYGLRLAITNEIFELSVEMIRAIIRLAPATPRKILKV